MNPKVKMNDGELVLGVAMWKERAMLKATPSDRVALSKMPLRHWFNGWFDHDSPRFISESKKEKWLQRLTFLMVVRDLRHMAYELVAPEKLKQTLYDCLGYSPRLVYEALFGDVETENDQPSNMSPTMFKKHFKN